MRKLLLLQKRRFAGKGKKQSLTVLCKEGKAFSKFHDNYQKIRQKYQIYIIIQKVYFQQYRQKVTNQTLSINFGKTLADMLFLN